MRREPGEHLQRRLGERGGERPLLQSYDGPGDPRGRPTGRRGRGVAAAALGPQLDRGGALLGDADHPERRVHTRERLVRDGAALVEHEPRRHPARAELLDRGRGVGAGDLLARAEGQPDVARRDEALLEQPLDGRADRRPASPCRRGCRGPRSRRRGSRRRRAGAARAPTRRSARRRCAPSARAGRRRRALPVEEQRVVAGPGAASGARAAAGTPRPGRRGTPRTRPGRSALVGVGDGRDADQRSQLLDDLAVHHESN